MQNMRQKVVISKYAVGDVPNPDIIDTSEWEDKRGIGKVLAWKRAVDMDETTQGLDEWENNQ